ncbi:MAG: UDP-4-amino-4,6-dideoxy-N-acetyl-beta-L-altrosamine transaminase, partial [Magnetovibrio sp.]|nr:UDP-4-amino-4,6-dideoxy-N-acetyl-beta-L-altrosamine transaminase [Magnetovibrio sp.]
MTPPFLRYGSQSIDESDMAAVREVLESDFLTQGPAVERFEAALAERAGAKFAVAVNSGTAGLHIACLAAGMGPGSKGLSAAVTFVASVNCFKYTGAAAGLVDIDPVTLGMSTAGLVNALDADPSPDTVIPVHFAGLAGDSAGLRRAAGKRVLIEDACHALGGEYEDGLPVGCGAHADMAVFSFHPVKPITTAEGGAVVTNDAGLADRLRRFRNHGIERAPEHMTDPSFDPAAPAPWWYEQQDLGFNYRMSDLHAALGFSQLAKLDGFIARRREIAAYYDSAFSGLDAVSVPQNAPELRRRSALHLYLVRIGWRAAETDRTSFM